MKYFFPILILISGALWAQDEPQELHLLVASVLPQGIIADKMEPHESSTAASMNAQGMGSGITPADVNREAMARLLEPEWRPSGVLVFVRGDFPGVAEGDRPVVRAERHGAVKITAKSDGEERTVALWEIR